MTLRSVALLATGLLLLVGLPTVLRMITDSFLFHPQRGQERSPRALGLDYEELWLVSSDGTRTQAWWIPYTGPRERDLGLVVLSFHGNAGTMADRLEHTRGLHDLGVSVLAAEYRGYGDSEGAPSEQGLAMDALAAWEQAVERSPGRTASQVVLHGRSLGGAVAVRLASERVAAGLIIESSFTSLKEMAARSGIPLATHLLSYRFDSLDRLARNAAPVLVVHGNEDELIPFRMGQRLAEASRGQLLEVDGGTHNDTWIRGGAEYWHTLREWLGGVESSVIP